MGFERIDIKTDPPVKNKKDNFIDLRDYSDPTNGIKINTFTGLTGLGNSQFDDNIPLALVDNLQQIRAERQPWVH